MNERGKVMKKIYQTARVEILPVRTEAIMLLTSPPDGFKAPEKHFVPGPGASYDPQGSVV
jgi:hypothetical protein